VIEPRIYRSAFIPAVLVAILAMFSLEDRPPALPQGLPADVLFEEAPTVRTLESLVRRQPDRRPGTPGNATAAATVESTLRARGFEPEVDRFEESGVPLLNVVGRRAGASRREVLVVAGRDAGRVPDRAASAADTAALLELARVFEGRSSRRTLVLASVDGSTLGDAGTRRLLGKIDRDLVEAVLVVSNLGAGRSGESAVVQWAGDHSRANITLVRTAAAAVREQAGLEVGSPNPLSQLARLAAPLGLGAQGVALEGGFDAIRFSGSGELPAARDTANARRLGDLGRAVLRTVTAVDRTSGTLEHGPPTYLGISRKVLPGWAVSVLALALLLPALVASVDGLARAGRRREPAGRPLRFLLAGALPVLLGLLVAEFLVLVGLAPDAPPAPLIPGSEPLDGAALAVLGVVTAVIALAWIVGRPLLTGRGGGGAVRGGLVAAALSVTAIGVWAANPYAALVLVPAVHLWMLAALIDPQPRPLVSVALIGGGLVAPLLVAVHALTLVDLNPLEGVWYLFLLVTGGHVGVLGALLSCVLAGLLGSLVALLVARGARPAPAATPAAPLLGPSGYAWMHRP